MQCSHGCSRSLTSPARAFTAAETSAMSAWPARRAFAAPITLPMSPGPRRAELGDECARPRRRSRRRRGAAAGSPRAPSARPSPCRPGPGGRRRRTASIESLRCLTSLSTMRDDRGVVEHDALVDLALLIAASRPRIVQQARRVLGAHRGLHVFGDAVLQAHRLRLGVSTACETRSPRGGPGGLRGACGRRGRAQYSFFGSCMLRTRLKWRLTAAAFLRLRSAVGFS